MRMLPKRKAKSIITRFIKRVERETPAATFKVRREKNGRGDYGYDETFELNGSDVFMFSIDGARSDLRVYASESIQ